MPINMTPHPINVYSASTPDSATDAQLADGLLVSIPPSGSMARLESAEGGEEFVVSVDGTPVQVSVVKYGKLAGLPEPKFGALYIVPLLAALAASDRSDLLVPHELVRNTSNTVVGCRRFGRVARSN